MKDVICKNHIFINTTFSSQEEVFQFMAKTAVEDHRASNEEKLVQGFYDREREFSTAMNDGIAIPHCRIPEISDATVIVIRNGKNVKWTEEEEVNLFFGLLVPESNECQIHIKILAQVAQLIMEDDFIDGVKTANEPTEIFDSLSVLNQLT